MFIPTMAQNGIPSPVQSQDSPSAGMNHSNSRRRCTHAHSDFDRFVLSAATLALREKAGIKTLNRASKLFLVKKISTTCHLMHGEPKACLLQLVRQHQCNMVVLGFGDEGGTNPVTHAYVLLSIHD